MYSVALFPAWLVAVLGYDEFRDTHVVLTPVRSRPTEGLPGWADDSRNNHSDIVDSEEFLARLCADKGHLPALFNRPAGRTWAKSTTEETSSPPKGCARSPCHYEGFSRLPNGTCSGRILSGFVIDLGEARKRLRPRELDESLVPPVTRALALADEFQRLLDIGAIKRRADLARRFKLSRARVTQLLDLQRLHPDILTFVRNLSPMGPRDLSVRQLRLLSTPLQATALPVRGPISRD